MWEVIKRQEKDGTIDYFHINNLFQEFNMKKILFFILVFMFCISINPLFSKDRKYPENVCKEIFDTIGIFLTLADKEWEQTRNDERNELEKSKHAEKALFFSQAAANYSTVYETVCR